MSEIVGSIKINEERIITNKNGLIETWTRWGNGDENTFIVYRGDRYKLLKVKEKESPKIEKEKDIE